jgi:hypothetical protein
MIGGIIVGLPIPILVGAHDPQLAAKPFAIPLSEAYHDEPIGGVGYFTRWGHCGSSC